MKFLIVYIIVCLLLISLYSNYLRKSLDLQEKRDEEALACAKEYNLIMKDKKFTCECKKPAPKNKAEAKKSTRKK